MENETVIDEGTTTPPSTEETTDYSNQEPETPSEGEQITQKDDEPVIEESEGAETEGQETEQGSELPDDPAELKKLLEIAQKQTKEHQGAFTKKAQELARQKEELEALQKTVQEQGYQSVEHYQDAVIQQQIGQQYNQAFEQLLMKYRPYSAEPQALTYEEMIQGLPPEVAIQFGAEKTQLDAMANNEYSRRVEQQQQLASQQRKQHQEAMYEQFGADYKEGLDFFHNPNPTYESFIDVLKSYESRGYEKAKNEIAINQKQKADISRLQSGVEAGSQGVEGKEHIYTFEEIDKMSQQAYDAVEHIIDAQMAKGLVR